MRQGSGRRHDITAYPLAFLIAMACLGGCGATWTSDDVTGTSNDQAASSAESEAQIVAHSLSKTGIPFAIDAPEGTSINWVTDPDGLDDDSTEYIEIYFDNGNFFNMRMRRTMPLLDTVEHVYEYVTGINAGPDTKINPQNIEIIDDQVVIYHVRKETPSPSDAAYGMMAVISIGDDHFLFDNWDGPPCTRAEIELMSRCVQSLKSAGEASDPPE